MLVLTRHDVPPDGTEAFLVSARAALAALAACPGFVDGAIARAVDEPSLLVLQTRWVDVGSYRRALSSWDVRLRAIPLLSRARDEASAFEVLHARDGEGVRDAEGALAADHDRVALGEAAAAHVEPMPS